MANFPGGFPGLPGGFPGLPGFPIQPGRPPTNSPGGLGNPPPPTQQTINQFQSLSQNPAQAQNMLHQSGPNTFAVGCEGRWTTILLRNGQLFLMYVFSTNLFGSTTGIIWPNFTFASFPSRTILAYNCF